MAAIGAGGGIAHRQRVHHRSIVDPTRQGAVPDAVELAVPGIGRRHPDLKVDRRLHQAGHPAEGDGDGGTAESRVRRLPHAMNGHPGRLLNGVDGLGYRDRHPR